MEVNYFHQLGVGECRPCQQATRYSVKGHNVRIYLERTYRNEPIKNAPYNCLTSAFARVPVNQKSAMRAMVGFSATS